jgi:glycosyltransferase involved in cell wall biosynthesis
MITRDYYPTYDTMLESVFTEMLPDCGYEITWLMPSRTITKRTVVYWNKAEVFLFPVPANPHGLYAFAMETCAWVRLLVFAGRLLRRKHFDIIQTRTKILAEVFAWVVSKLTRIKHVSQFDYPHPEQTIKVAREERIKNSRLHILHAHLQIFLRDWVYRHTELVLAISDEMRRQLIASGVRSDRVVTFPMGTDCPPDPTTALMARLRVNLKLKNFPVVIYFGVIHPIRQLDFVIRVASRVKTKQPLTRWLFVGYGSEVEKSRLMQLAQEQGLAGQVLFTGPVPRAEVPAYFSLANVSVSPIPISPIYWLSSPSKNIDSLANDCPVVGTNIPDQAKVISESGGGIIVPFEEQAFATAVCKLLGNQKLAQEMGQQGKAYVRKYRSYKYLSKRLDEQYQELLAPTQP